MSEVENNAEENQPVQAGSLEERVEAALDEIRPHIQRDGGDIELVEVTEDKVVKVQLKGACAGCPMSMMTLKNGVEKYVREKAPEVVSVEAVGLTV
jgi:Fe-S cluster biogenesis protein NfuA